MRPLNRAPACRGMTLVEALVGLLLLSLVLVALLALLDLSVGAAAAQGAVADLTESLRFARAALARAARMAGSGGLPLVVDSGAGLRPVALEVDDNVQGGSVGGRVVVDGTDVLRVRGILTGVLYDLGPGDADLAAGVVTLAAASTLDGRPRALEVPPTPAGHPLLLRLVHPLAIRAVVGGGLVIARHYSDYRVVEVAGAEWSDEAEAEDEGTWVRLRIDAAGVGSLNPGGRVAPACSSCTTAAAFLDDLAFFVGVNEAGGPSLYRCRGDAVAEELVPDISDLQVALGCDVDADRELRPAEYLQSAVNPTAPSGSELLALVEVRLALAARTPRPDRRYTEAPPRLENGAHSVPGASHHRHRATRITVALRSQPPLEVQ